MLLGLKPGGLTHPLPVVVTTGKEAAATRGYSNKNAQRADTLGELIFLVILNFMFRQKSKILILQRLSFMMFHLLFCVNNIRSTTRGN